MQQVQPHVLAADVLGHDYTAETIPLPADDEGDVVATLIRRRPSAAAEASGRAVLYVHGYNDYFFQRGLADFWDAAGYAFYAVDLRKNGRSLRPWQTPSFVRRLHEYAADLDAAMARIVAEKRRVVVVVAHSTGGLTSSLWLHHRRGRHGVGALVLNSPFLDLPGTPTDRVIASAAGLAGRLRPYAVVPRGTVDTYARTLHIDHGGEWDYDMEWKPAGGIPLRTGWLGAVRAGHREVRRGLAVDVPVLAMSSSESWLSKTWDERALRADCVLDAERIALRARRLGPDVSVVRIDGGVHDLVLSAPEVRERVYAETARWLGERFPAEQAG